METTMAVQNHDGALDEKEQMELKYTQSKGMVINLQDRVRQLESAFTNESRAPSWTPEQLHRVQHAFERSSHAATRIIAAHPSADVAIHNDANISNAQTHHSAHVEVQDRSITFRSDYFCTWLTTDADAKQFGVEYRARAVECGAAMLEHKVLFGLMFLLSIQLF